MDERTSPLLPELPGTVETYGMNYLRSFAEVGETTRDRAMERIKIPRNAKFNN